MPELPEVEHGRRLAQAVAVGRRIVAVRAARDPIVFERAAPRRIEATLEGRRVCAARRHGKHLWLELDRRPWPVFHFGMTGALRAPARPRLRLRSHGARPDDGWPPRFVKLSLSFDDGGELAFTNARRLGRVRLRDDPPREPPIVGLGFDPLTDLPNGVRFASLLLRRRGSLKSVLLDQSFAAGVGNWIADETLYQARLDPRRRATSLTRDEILRLRRALGRIVATAVRADAEKARFPRTWLFHRRWGGPEGTHTVRGEPIERLTLAGRTTAWVPSVQR